MPAYRTQSVVFGKAFVNRLLAAIKTNPAAALLAAGKVRLSKDPAYNPAPNAVLADLVANEADFTGYPAGGLALVMSDPLNLGPAAQAIVADALFVATGPFLVANGIYGWWIDDGAIYVAGERFMDGQAVNFGGVGDFLELDLRLPLADFQAAAA